MKGFEKFIVSPFFNKGRNYLPLYKALKTFHPAFDNPKLIEENIFKKAYKNQKYDKKKSSTLRSMMSRLNELAEKFMVYNGFETGSFGFHFNTLRADEYYEKKLLDLALKVTLRNSKFIDNDIKTDYYFSRRLEISSSLSNIFILQLRPHERVKYNPKDVLYIYAEMFFRFTAFHNAHNLDKISYNLIRKGEDLVMHFVKTFDPELFDKECDEDDYETKNLTLIKYYYLKSHIDDNPRESILKAIDIYMNIFDKLTRHRHIQFNKFILLMNMCVARSGYDSLFMSKGNDLIDFVWGRGVISHDMKQHIETKLYFFVLHFKMSFLDSSGILKFVSKYSDKTEPEYVEDIKNFSYACIYFKEKSFGKCLERLSKKDSLSFPEIKLYRNELKLSSLYELSYFEGVLSEIDSFEHFLRKNKNISDFVKKLNFKFVNGVRKLIKINLGKLVASDIEMKEVMELTQNSLWGFWFKEKVEELKCKSRNNYIS